MTVCLRLGPKCECKYTAELFCETADEAILSGLQHEVGSQNWTSGVNAYNFYEFESG